jgi:citrate synthase
MLDTQGERDFKPHPVLVKALEVLFILHAEHEMSCSTAALRHIASAGVDLYSAVAAAAGALSGPKHGGANGAVIGMLESIGTKDNIRRFLIEVKQKRRVLFGFGNRVYKSYDPRAKIVKRVAESVFALCGKEPLIELALEL